MVLTVALGAPQRAADRTGPVAARGYTVDIAVVVAP
jgi:hypothetical protein